MALRDAGWVQLFAASNQDAADLHVQAYRLAEELSLPVMVCMDGFVLTHATEPIAVPAQDEVDAYLPPFEPRQVLDVADPVSIGAMVGPDAFEEVRYLAHARMLEVLDRMPLLSEEFERVTGRRGGGLVDAYRVDGASLVIVAMGSVLGTIADAVDACRADGDAVGSLGVTTFRPFPSRAVRSALEGARRVVVIDRAISPGWGGVLATDVAMALHGTDVEVTSVVAGLGGRPVTGPSLRRVVAAANDGELPDITFLDLDRRTVDAELTHMASRRRSGPTAENVLRHRARLVAVEDERGAR